MKKNIMAIAILAASAFTFSASAQTPDNSCPQQCPQQKCRVDANRPNRYCFVDSTLAFKGITLTADQSAAVARINAETRAAQQKARAERQQAKDRQKVEKQQMKEQVKNMTDEQRQQFRAERQKAKAEQKQARAEARMQARLDYFHQIQKVLSPDQYVTFLENTAASAATRPAKDMRPGKGPRGNKDMSRGERRGRPDKGMRDGKGPRGNKDMRGNRPAGNRI